MKANKKYALALVIALTLLVSCLPISGLAAEPFGKYETPIELTVVQSVTVNADQENRTETNNFKDFIEKQLGIRIVHKWVTTPEQYDQKVALMLATDDLPDVMLVDMKTLGQMIDAGQVADLTDLWKEYADPLTNSLMNPEGSTGFGMATRNGRLYGIPQTTPTLESLQGLFLREDWRVKLNLPEPSTFEELEKILYAFVQNDPDGNGKNDTYAIGMNKELYGNGYDMIPIANAMHAYPNAWIKGADGKVVYGSVQPEMKNVLAKLSQWYKDGLIDPEFTVKNPEKEAEMVLKEQMGAFFGVQWAHLMSGALADLYLNNIESDWKLWKTPSIDESPAKPIVYDNTRQFAVVSSKCEHPEAVIKVLNLMHKLGAGNCVDILPTLDEFNAVWDDWTWMFVKPESIHGNIPKWEALFAALETRDESLVEYNYNVLDLYKKLLVYMDNPQYRTSQNNDERQLAKNRWANIFSGKLFAMATELNKQGLLTYEQCGAINTDTMVESLAQLQKMELETFTRIITGDAPVDEFDNFVKSWNDLGGAKIMEEINSFYGL